MTLQKVDWQQWKFDEWFDLTWEPGDFNRFAENLAPPFPEMYSITETPGCWLYLESHILIWLIVSFNLFFYIVYDHVDRIN